MHPISIYFVKSWNEEVFISTNGNLNFMVLSPEMAWNLLAQSCDDQLLHVTGFSCGRFAEDICWPWQCMCTFLEVIFCCLAHYIHVILIYLYFG